MILSTILLTHIVLGISTLVLIAGVLVRVGTVGTFPAVISQSLRTMIFAVAAADLCTGALLVVWSPSVTGWAACSGMLLYMCAVVGAMFALRNECSVVRLPRSAYAFYSSAGIFTTVTLLGY